MGTSNKKAPIYFYGTYMRLRIFGEPGNIWGL